MKRRIILLAIVAVVLVGGIGVGVHLHRSRNRGTKLMERIQIAIQAEKFDKAEELARRYASQNPDDWQGEYYIGRALQRKGNLSEARQAFQEAHKKAPNEIRPTLALAETYSFPARATLRNLSRPADVEDLREAIQKLHKANDLLAEMNPQSPEDQMKRLKDLSLNLERIAYGEGILAERLHEMAELADLGTQPEKAEQNRQLAARAETRAHEANVEAARNLLEYIRGESADDQVGELLVRICLDAGLEETFATAREVILSRKDDLPSSAVRIWMNDLAEIDRSASEAEQNQQVDRIAEQVDEILQDHPDLASPKVARARLAYRAGDYARCEELCRDVLDNQSDHAMAGLMLGRALLAQNKPQQAEEVLQDLKARQKYWPEAHYAYALTAEALGKTELAQVSMREVTQISPDHAGARGYMARHLLRQGHYDQALNDARPYLQAHPDDPNAILLFTEAAVRSRAPEQVRPILEKAEADHAQRPDILVAVRDAYAYLRDSEAVDRLTRQIAEASYRTEAQAFAVARAKRMVGQTAQAESILREVIKANPESAQAEYELGNLMAATGRMLQAQEHYERAVELDPRMLEYRIGLAQTLLDTGMVNRALRECQVVLDRQPRHPEALQLAEQARAILGESSPTDPNWSPAAAGQLARRYLQIGDFAKAIEQASKEIGTARDDRELRLILAEAYLAEGKTDQALEQFREVLAENPEDFGTYLRIVTILRFRYDPSQLREVMEDLPRAKPELATLAVGHLLEGRGDFADALAMFDEVLSMDTISGRVRGMARMGRTRCLARLGRGDDVLRETARLMEDPLWRDNAMLIRAQVLWMTGQQEQARELFETLVAENLQSNTPAVAEDVAELYLVLQQPEEAKAICDRLIASAPQETRPYLFAAGVHRRLGELGPAESLLRDAIERQPGNLRAYLLLAEVQDAQLKFEEALKTLDRMADFGQTGTVQSLFARGSMLAGWGLADEAIRCIRKLEETGLEDNPRLRLALARAHATLGQNDMARELLESIPPYVGEYVTARHYLATLQTDPQKKLDILRDLQKQRPGLPGVMTHIMSVLVEMDRFNEAYEEYLRFKDTYLQSRPVPVELAEVALDVLLVKADRKRAAALAGEVARNTGSPLWRYRAVLLGLAAGEDVSALLPTSPQRAELYLVPLSILASLDEEDPASTETWMQRLAEMDGASEGMPGAAQGLVLKYRFLASIATGDADMARSMLPRFEAFGLEYQLAARELVDYATSSGSGPDEARSLLRASLAEDFHMPELAERWAMGVLGVRPRCQWAAALAGRVDSSAEGLGKVLAILEPADATLAKILRARSLALKGQYLQAADLYAQAAKAQPNARLEYAQAQALERAGQLSEALRLYRKAMEVSANPSMVNDAAYLVTVLHADDADRLAEAAGWMDSAMEQFSSPPPALLDTAGWIAFLRGDTDTALPQLRRAVKGLKVSVEVHYHLGRINEAIGNDTFAQWHYASAVNYGQKLQQQNELPPLAKQAWRWAKERLDRGSQARADTVERP